MSMTPEAFLHHLHLPLDRYCCAPQMDAPRIQPIKRKGSHTLPAVSCDVAYNNEAAQGDQPCPTTVENSIMHIVESVGSTRAAQPTDLRDG